MEQKKLFEPQPAHPIKFYGWVLLLALLLRILWAMIAMPITPVSDSQAYDIFAQNLATDNVYGWKITEPTSYWPPGTSFIYSVFYRLFGHTYIPIVFLNLFLGIVIIWTSMHLAERWFNCSVALLTGLLLALWPVTIQFTTILSSELLFTALLLVAMRIWFTEHLSWWLKSLSIGLVLAAASYVRTAGILIPILLLLFSPFNVQSILKNLGTTIVIWAVMLLLIAPWSIRNMQLYGQFVLISTNTGCGLWIGNNPKTEHGGHMAVPEEIKEKMKGMNIVQQEDYLKAEAIAYIKAEPLQFFIRTVNKLIHLHSRETIGVAWNESGLVSNFGTKVLLPLKMISQGYWLFMLILSLVGIVLLSKQQGLMKMIIHPTIVIWGYFALGHAMTEISDRYHFYSIPVIAILAALSISFFKDKMINH